MIWWSKIPKRKKAMVISCLAIFVICGVTLGYALLSSSLQINGTGTISTNWDILFTSIEEKSSKGATTNSKEITDKLNAIFDVNIEAPGNYIEYNVTIKNNGNMDAVIEHVTGIVEANSETPTGIQFQISGLRVGDDLLAGTEKTFVVRAEIPASETILPSGTKTLDLKVNVRQKDIDSSGIITTFKDCFQTNETGETITKYLCGKNNPNGYSEILDVTIPSVIDEKTITKIGSHAFYNNMIYSVIFPNTITTIEMLAFYSNKLETVTIPDSVTIIGNSAFSYNLLTEINIPNSVTSLGITVFKNNNMANDQAFIYNRNSDGTEDKTSINSYAGAEQEHIIMPEQVTTIGMSAFANMDLKKIELSKNLLWIKNSAFGDNQLATLVIPASVRYIEDTAFANNKLTHVEFQGAIPDILGNKIFMGNQNLTTNTIKVPNGSQEQYTTVQKQVDNIVYLASEIWFGSDDESLLDAFYE